MVLSGSKRNIGKRETREETQGDGTERICRRTRIGSKGDEGGSGRIVHGTRPRDAIIFLRDL